MAGEGIVFMAAIYKFVPITRARKHFFELIRQVDNEGSTIAVTKNGMPTAIILNLDKFEGLLETLEILSDERTLKSFRKSIRQARRNNWVSYQSVFGRGRATEPASRLNPPVS